MIVNEIDKQSAQSNKKLCILSYFMIYAMIFVVITLNYYIDLVSWTLFVIYYKIIQLNYNKLIINFNNF